ncbi:hypothetical protein E3N88_28808 [Mikania micrantha]|uniref:Uncharacterized protein n=1 Tax=Mikania micrantha TaxID=192012 RepID=A0A5N6N1N4_9ASTR|nr:hypothetical protein E3N88_28808 [Mikania micrantha]
MSTIVSTEFIKPSSATPPHLKTYNLSVYDQLIPSTFNPLVIFYPNSGIYHNPHDQIHYLKKSLSHILTKYYPFAGRHAKFAPTYVDCNDLGAEFIEASIDGTLLDFLQNSQHEDLDRLFPHGQTWNSSKCSSGHVLQSDTVIVLAVQVNRFTCEGLAVAVSLSHKIADAYSLIRFLHDWAKMSRGFSKNKTGEVPAEPCFLSFENTNINFSGFSLELSNDCVTRSFIFPNAKIHELKLKVSAMSAGSGQHITNPTRVEAVAWLLYKCAVEATTKYKLDSFSPTYMSLPINLRNRMIKQLPENCIGNFVTGLEVHTRNEMEMKPEMLIGELRNQKTKIHCIKDIETVFASLLITSSNNHLENRQRKLENAYIYTSLCGSSMYQIEFGWGTPIRVTAPRGPKKNTFVLLDAPNEEGIEVLVCLRKQDMDIIQSDPELLCFANVSSGAARSFWTPKAKL